MSKFNPEFQQRFAALQQALSSKVGMWQAGKQAIGILYGTLTQQASLTSYIHNFRLLGIICLICVPLVLLLKKVSAAKPPISAH
jgi:DHA2 family multidrug resistance protein